MRLYLPLTFGFAVLAVVLAPVFASEDRLEAAALYAALRPFCHQQVERAWWLAGEPLAVCVRCFGFYWGMAAGSFVAVQLGSRQAVVGAGALCLVSWGWEAAGLAALPAEWRFMTGLVVGLTASRAVTTGLIDTTRGGAELGPLAARNEQ